MIFAIPAVIQAAKGASLAVKVGVILGVVALILGAGFYAGSRWEESKTLKVQAKFDKFVADATLIAEQQAKETALENQRLKNAKELSDEENLRARDALKFYDERLRELTAKIANTSRMPGPPANTSRPDLTCFSRAELDRADADYRTREATLRARIHALIGEGSEAAVDLNTAKKWAQSLPDQRTK